MKWEIAAYAGVFLVALIMRLWDVGARAVHHDESLHGYFSWEFYRGLGYEHNPLMHGPFQFHGTAAIFMLFGDSDFTLRLLPVIFGSALVLVPWLLRPRLGNVGALVVSVMLAFSPTMLYYSRFARDDIYMAVWALGLVAVAWRYIDDRRPRWLYLTAALVAFGHATKETEYLIVGIVGAGLLVVAARSDVGRWLWGQRSIRQWGPAGQVLVVLSLLTLPLVGALAAVFQGPLGLTLAAPNASLGVPTGAPEGAGIAVAVVIVLVLLLASMAMGMWWNARVWVRVAAIFWAIYLFFFTTALGNIEGAGSGVWQGLGYWMAQQGVARGDQPWYYYFVITPIYEFLPLTIAIGGGIYYALRGDRFTRFLVFWAVVTFAAYTLAAEKMPWLLVNVALPLIVLAGKALGDVIATVQWRAVLRRGGWAVYLGFPLFLVLGWQLIYFSPDSSGGLAFASLWAMLAVIGMLLVGFYALTNQIGRKPAFSLVLTSAAMLMAAFTVRAAWEATYVNSDVPREMLIYTQTAPDIPRLMREIENVGTLTGDREDLTITIDATDGYTWPWAWYLRDYANVGYPDYSATPPEAAPDSLVAVVHAKNNAEVRDKFQNGFQEGRKLVHRWWFPEKYRGLTFGSFVGTIFHRSRWRTAVDYFLYRKLPEPIGGVDAYVYFSDRIPLRSQR